MKYLLVIALALVVIWLWRSNRRPHQEQAPSKPVPRNKPATEVVACAVCAVHLPRAEALPGGKGFYCSDAHRRQAEGK